MGISYIANSAMDDGLGFDFTAASEFGPDGQMAGLLKGLDSSAREKHGILQQRQDDLTGDQIAALYHEWRPQLFRYIRSMNLSRHETEEIIQETFMRLTKQLLKVNNIENVQGWIVRVAHNLAVDQIRKNERDPSDASDQTAAFERRIDPTPNPEEAYSRKEQIRRMMIVLSGLEPRRRQCFQMRARGVCFKNIGLALGISEQRAALLVKQVAVRLAATCG